MSVAFGEFVLEPASFELRRGGTRVPMEPQAFDVLAYLARHRDRLVSKEELMDQIWGGRFVTESAVTSRIKQARRATGDDGRAQRVISTVHGRGYRFVAPVHGDPQVARSVADPEPSPARTETSRAAEPTAPRQIEESSDTVGRRPELAAIDRALQRARDGNGGVVVVSGEPGIGKSALLAAATARAVALGARVLTGRAVADAGPFRPLAQALLDPWHSAQIRQAEALRPFRRALDRVLPGWTPAPGDVTAEPGVDPALLIAEGLSQILTATGPDVGLLAIDDVHDADPDTLGVLDELAAAAPRRPMLIMITRRDWPRSAAVDRLTGLPGTVRLPLGRLAPSDVEDLVGAAGQLPPETVASIVALSEGLPLVATELAAAAGSGDVAGWDRPEGFSALVRARLSGLDARERQLLSAGAAFGREPDWDLAAAICGLDEPAAFAALRRAVQLHLLTSSGEGLPWRHGMVRQVVWSELLPPERRNLTRSAAELLVTRGGSSDATRAAELMITVGDVDGAVGLWLGRVRAATSTGGLRSAAEWLDRAEQTGRQPAAVAIERVGLLSLTGHAVEALDAGLPLLAEARGDEHAELCLRLARAAGAAGRWGECDQLVSRAGRVDDARSAILSSDSAHARGRMAEAEQYAVAAVSTARVQGRPEVLCEALCAEARVRRPYDPQAARRLFAESAQLASEHGLLPWRVEALFGLATIEMLLEEQSSELRQMRRIALDAGLLGRVAQADLLLADHLLVRDGPAGSAEPAARVGEFGRLARIRFLGFTGEILLATRSALAGDDRAMEFRLGPLETVTELPPDSPIQIAAVRGLAAMVRHDLDSAAGLLDSALWPMTEHRAAAPLVVFGAWALLATLVRSDAGDVRAVLAEQTAGRRRANQGALRYADAVVAGRSGDRARAEAALAEGDALLAATPWWQRFLRTYALEAAVTEGWADAVPRLRVDLAAFEEAGEESLARLARDLLRRAGAPTRRGRGDSSVPIALRAVGVTSREMDVLRLIEQHQTNADIAARLFLSPRTVETHVTSLLSKSGAANRGELASWASAGQ